MVESWKTEVICLMPFAFQIRVIREIRGSFSPLRIRSVFSVVQDLKR